MHIDFEYANKRLSDFGCILCSFDGGSNEDVDIGCDITFNTVKNNYSSVHSKTSTSYDNMYTTSFDIMKNPCENNNDMFFTEYEARAITKWLNRREYHKFKLYNPDFNVMDFYYYGSFNVKQKMMSGKIIGFSLTFTANAPYAFSEKIVIKHMILNTSDSFSLYGESDEYGVIYPKIEIKCLEDFSGEENKLCLTNETTGTKIELKNCNIGETITIDGEYKIIFTDKKEHTTLPNDFNYEFLDILVDEYNNENVYSATLPCEITISYSPIRKIGVM